MNRPTPLSTCQARPAAVGFAVVGLLLFLLVTGCRQIPTAAARPEARLMGTLWWMSPNDLNRPIAAWQAEFDQLEALGIRILVLNGPFFGENPPPGAADPTEAFFNEADRRGLSIYMDTLSAPDWWTLSDPAPEIARARARIESLNHRYGQHRSFTGWYIPYELYVMWDAPAELITVLYRDISAACKRVSPPKPVMLSPFFILDQAGDLGSFRWATPAEYQQFWTTLLQQSQVDIVALQDSGEHLSCYTLDQRRPFLAAMKSACATANKQFWINIEVGELNVASLSDYTNRFGYKTHVNDPKTATAWQAVAPDKLRYKLELAGEYTDTSISWGYQQFIRPTLGPEAVQLHQAYEAILTNRNGNISTR
ncbi:MAG: DUF4434 domain-containing protein [Verrucomicrobiota bacterium]